MVRSRTCDKVPFEVAPGEIGLGEEIGPGDPGEEVDPGEKVDPDDAVDPGDEVDLGDEGVGDMGVDVEGLAGVEKGVEVGK